jgi:tetratricopeptide (TPR) repeat protein
MLWHQVLWHQAHGAATIKIMKISPFPGRLALCATLAITVAVLPAAGQGTRRHYLPSGGYGDFLSAQYAIATNDLGIATDKLMAVLATDPAEPDVANRAFLAGLLAGRGDTAMLARRLTQNALAVLLLADNDIIAGRWAAAQARFTALPHLPGLELVQPLLQAWAMQGAGHTDDALALLNKQVQSGRLRGIAALHGAAIADLAGRNAEAGRLYQVATDSPDGSVTLRLAQMQASWLARQGKQNAALEALTGMVHRGQPMAMALPALTARISAPVVRNARDGVAEAYLVLAAALHQQNSDEFAQMLLRLALDLRPDLTAARLLLADLQDNPKPLQPAAQPAGWALETLAPVAADDPLISIVQLRRAVFLVEAGHGAQAEAALGKLAAAYPTSPEPLAELGDVLRRQSRFAEAATAYGAALDRLNGPVAGSWRLLFDRGMSLERAHDWAHAEPDLRKAAELAPQEPTVLNYLAYAWADRGENLPQARAMLERAAAAEPNNGAIVDSLGWVLFRSGDLPGAVAKLEHAVELLPEDSEVNGHLGDGYWAAGRTLEAEYQWHRALNLHPEPDAVAPLETKLKDAATADAAAAKAAAGTAKAEASPAMAPSAQP